MLKWKCVNHFNKISCKGNVISSPTTYSKWKGNSINVMYQKESEITHSFSNNRLTQKRKNKKKIIVRQS